jgi:hypothetical protein
VPIQNSRRPVDRLRARVGDVPIETGRYRVAWPRGSNLGVPVERNRVRIRGGRVSDSYAGVGIDSRRIVRFGTRFDTDRDGINDSVSRLARVLVSPETLVGHRRVPCGGVRGGLVLVEVECTPHQTCG